MSVLANTLQGLEAAKFTKLGQVGDAVILSLYYAFKVPNAYAFDITKLRQRIERVGYLAVIRREIANSEIQITVQKMPEVYYRLPVAVYTAQVRVDLGTFVATNDNSQSTANQIYTVLSHGISNTGQGLNELANIIRATTPSGIQKINEITIQGKDYIVDETGKIIDDVKDKASKGFFDTFATTLGVSVPVVAAILIVGTVVVLKR